MSNAIANQLFLAYLGRPADVAWRNATGLLLTSGAPTPQLQNAFFAAAVADGTFALTDSSSQLVNKIFLNVFGFGARTDEQAAWASLIQNGTITTQSAAWTIFSSYLGSSTVPDSYKLPAQSKLMAVEAYTAELQNNPTANLALSSGTPSVTLAAKSFISSITSQATAGAAILPAAIASTVAGLANAQTGSAFLLTTGVDNLIGTSSNDTFTADNTVTTARQLSVADSINGGSGTDTLKVYLNSGDLTVPAPSLTSVENVYINGGAVTAYTAVSGTTGLTIDSPQVNTAATYTVSGQSVTLQNHNVTASTITTVAYGSTATSAALTLTGETKTGALVVNTIDVSSSSVATLNLTSATTANVITLANTNAGLKTINIDGGANLTLTTNNNVSAALTGVDASKATGNIALDTSAGTTVAGFAFTGGAGNDALSLTSASLTALTAGTQLNGGAGSTDKIGLVNTGALTLVASDYAKLNAAIGFEVLGVSATTSATVDASQLTTIKSFAIDVAATGTDTISNLQAGSTVSLNAAANAVTLAPAIGVNSVAINIAGGVTVPTLTTTGLSTLTIATTGTAGTAQITNLANSDNSSITITGPRAFTTTLANGSATGSSIDGSAATGVLTLSGSGFADVIKGGSGADRITGDKAAFTTGDTLTGGAGIDTFVFNGTANAVFTGSLAVAGQVDRITDFVVGTDKIALVNTATPVTSIAAVTAVTVATAADVAAILTSVGNQVAVSTAASLNVGLITVSAGAAAGTYLLINDLANAAAATDSLINITGVSGTITTADFVFA